jgi:Ala-tRNA(Pro) deacylase
MEENKESTDPVEDPATNLALEKFLQEKNIQFSKLLHKACKTSEESAQVRNTTLASGAKAMLLKVDPDIFVLAVLSAAKKLSWKGIRKVLGTKKVNLATEDEVKNLTKCIPGAVPPFGSLWKIKTYVDNSLFQQGDVINFNAGLRTCSFTLKGEDYKNVEEPIVTDFSE